MADIKLVRDRAWGGCLTGVMQDGANFDGTPAAPITDPLQMVYSEYRHELTGEYSLFYDLRRAGAQDAADFINTTYGTQSIFCQYQILHRDQRMMARFMVCIIQL